MAYLRAGWAALTTPRPSQTVTISRFEGDEPHRHAIPMVTFTFEHRGVDWSQFERALGRAERAFAAGNAETASTLRSEGVRIDVHPGYWSASAEDRDLDRHTVIEAFKIAKRQP
ncbi:MAG: hypothetical protein ABIO39_11665 [Caulobacteraceae bacterium]